LGGFLIPGYRLLKSFFIVVTGYAQKENCDAKIKIIGSYQLALVPWSVPEMWMQLLDQIEFPPVLECTWRQLVLATRNDKVGLK